MWQVLTWDPAHKLANQILSYLPILLATGGSVNSWNYCHSASLALQSFFKASLDFRYIASFLHTNTHTHTHTHARTHTHTHVHTNSCTQTHTRTHTHVLSLSDTLDVHFHSSWAQRCTPRHVCTRWHRIDILSSTHAPRKAFLTSLSAVERVMRTSE